MLTIEEYVARRKKEDRLNEFELDKRNENTRLCVDYVFEYFGNYLNITESEEKTALNSERLEKYRKQLRDYDEDVAGWLVSIFAEYGKKLNLTVGIILKQDEFFYLYDSEQDFRRLSYDCYSKIIRKLPFLRDQTEMLFRFIKNYHRVMSQPGWESKDFNICDGIDQWVQDTQAGYQVNIRKFASSWVERYWHTPDLWPATHRKRSLEEWRKYEYDFKQTHNLFNIDSLYRKMPKRPFTRGRKQEFEVLMMYYWLNDIEGDDQGYWQEYLEKTLPSLNKI